MTHDEERLREMLDRRASRVESSLTLSELRDRGLRVHRHRSPILGPALVAACVAIVVVVISLTGRQTTPPVPPAGPGPGQSTHVGTGVQRETPAATTPTAPTPTTDTSMTTATPTTTTAATPTESTSR